MTKVELIQAIKVKVRKAKPIVKKYFLGGLKYKTKPELERILRNAHVSRDGFDISLI